MDERPEHTERTQGGYISTESEMKTEQHRTAAGPPDARERREDRMTTERRTGAHRAPEPEGSEFELGEAGA